MKSFLFVLLSLFVLIICNDAAAKEWATPEALRAFGNPGDTVKGDSAATEAEHLSPAKKKKKNSKTLQTSEPSSQKAEYEKDGFQFRKDVVVDTTTGLTWARNGNIAGGRIPWDNAIALVNTLNYGGYRDWRLPTKNELVSMSKRGGDNQLASYFNSLGFHDVQPNYWSSTSYPYISNYAWYLFMYKGILDFCPKTDSSNVWPVRGGQ